MWRHFEHREAGARGGGRGGARIKTAESSALVRTALSASKLDTLDTLLKHRNNEVCRLRNPGHPNLSLKSMYTTPVNLAQQYTNSSAGISTATNFQTPHRRRYQQQQQQQRHHHNKSPPQQITTTTTRPPPPPPHPPPPLPLPHHHPPGSTETPPPRTVGTPHGCRSQACRTAGSAAPPQRCAPFSRNPRPRQHPQWQDRQPVQGPREILRTLS